MLAHNSYLYMRTFYIHDSSCMYPFFSVYHIHVYPSHMFYYFQQFLDMLGSNQKERAVLLCNYFFHHNQEAWVVVGRGIPEGIVHACCIHTVQAHTHTHMYVLMM